MLTNPETWQNLLRWNRFRITYSDYRLFIRYNIIVETQRLSVVRIGQNRSDRLELMVRLSDEGYSNKEISEYLNRHNIRTPKGLEYYPNLVWSTLFKYRRRQQRFSTDKLVRLVETLVVIKTYPKLQSLDKSFQRGR